MRDPKVLTGPVKFLQKAIVTHPDGRRFLGLQRARSASSRPGCWDLPGGNVGYGEAHEHAIRREIEEETSLSVRDLRVVQVRTQFQDGTYLLFIAHRCRALSDTVRLSDEHDSYRWMTVDEFLPLPSAPYLRECVQHAHASAFAAGSGILSDDSS